MKSIRLKGFRSLHDTKQIELKPLTVIVGANGSGKSTFLRSFPMLRQSAEAKPKGPILFFGDYVDFGSFAEFVSSGEESSELSITLNFDLSAGRRALFFQRSLTKTLPANLAFSIETIIGARTEDGTPHICGLNVKFLDHKILLRVGDDHYIESFIVNKSDFSSYAEMVYALDDGVLVPSFHEWIKAPEGRGEFRALSGLPSRAMDLSLPSKLDDALHRVISRYEHGNTTKERILDFLFSVGCRQKPQMMDMLKNSEASTSTWHRAVANSNRPRVVRDLTFLSDALVLSAFLELSTQLSRHIAEFSKNVKYIAPLRATAERYYRRQNLSVNEVDFRGDNLTMFVASLNGSDRRHLEGWLTENFGFKILARGTGGHLALRIQHSDSNETHNIADEGFGYSQVLPIIVQLWSIIYNTSPRKRGDLGTVLYVIEQPELHLHPRMQCTLTDAFCTAGRIAKEHQIDLKILIETHSESIINRLGRNIGKRRINSDDVVVSVFNKSGPTDATEVIRSTFEEDGYLKNWPYGFFEPRD